MNQDQSMNLSFHSLSIPRSKRTPSIGTVEFYRMGVVVHYKPLNVRNEKSVKVKASIIIYFLSLFPLELKFSYILKLRIIFDSGTTQKTDHTLNYSAYTFILIMEYHRKRSDSFLRSMLRKIGRTRRINERKQKRQVGVRYCQTVHQETPHQRRFTQKHISCPYRQ